MAISILGFWEYLSIKDIWLYGIPHLNFQLHGIELKYLNLEYVTSIFPDTKKAIDIFIYFLNIYIYTNLVIFDLRGVSYDK